MTDRELRECPQTELYSEPTSAEYKVADVEALKQRVTQLTALLLRISTDIAQTVIEDPIQAAEGWAMLSQPVLKDIQAALAQPSGEGEKL